MCVPPNCYLEIIQNTGPKEVMLKLVYLLPSGKNIPYLFVVLPYLFFVFLRVGKVYWGIGVAPERWEGS